MDLSILKEFFPGKTPAEEAMAKLMEAVKESPSAKDLHSYVKGSGAAAEDLVTAMNQAAYNLGKDRIVREGLFPMKAFADPASSGYMRRAAKEYEAYRKQLARNKKMALAAGLAGLLGYGAYNVFKDDSPEMPNPEELMRRYSKLLEEGIVTTLKKRSALSGISAVSMLLAL